jgi:hypothetical protein
LTGLLLATLLNLSPGIQLADNVEARNVALSEARLPLLFVMSDDDEDVRPSIDAMTREQLAAELRRLDDTRPGLGGPIALMVVGVALAVPGAGIVLAGVSAGLGFSGSYGSAVALVFAGFGVALLVVGVILAIVGSIKLVGRISARRAHSADVDEVRKRIDTLDQAPPTAPPPPGPELMPPPPPPPPQANFVMPGAMQTVMTF